MKTSEERAAALLERRDEHRRRQRRLARSLTAGAACVAVAVAAVCYALPRHTVKNSTETGTPPVLDTADDYSAVFACISPRIAALYGNGINEIVEEADGVPEGAVVYNGSHRKGAAPTRATAPHGLTTNEPADTAHSETNSQVEGVQEGDCVKTDGRYLYAAVGKTLSITAADGGQMTECWHQDTGSVLPVALQLVGDRLAVIGERPVSGDGFAENETVILVYDITDRTAPRLIDTVAQSGWNSTTRLIGTRLYAVSCYTVYRTPVKEQPETYIPCVYNGTRRTCLEAPCIQLNADTDNADYAVLTVVELTDGTVTDKTAILGYGNTVYCTADTLYLAGTVYRRTEEIARENAFPEDRSATKIIRVSLADGKVKTAASGTVTGVLYGQFALDEYDGYLRVVTQRSGACLTVLNGELKPVGTVEGIARGEQVKSVRFLGEYAYVVTFRQTDPLFTLDLRDPTAPKVVGELKLPGFSEYLHPYGDGLLFGLGQEADETTGVTKGVKLSMFDTADPTAVTEITTERLPNTFSAAEYNHTALLIDTEQNLIGFSVGSAYCFYRYTAENGFECLAKIANAQGEYSTRAVYCGTTAYVLTMQSNRDTFCWRAYSMQDYRAIGELFSAFYPTYITVACP